MNLARAVKIAVECLRSQKRKYAFDANLERQFHLGNPSSINALAKVLEIDETISFLENLANQKKAT